MICYPSSAGASVDTAEQKPADQKGRVNGPLNDEAFLGVHKTPWITWPV